MNAISLQSKHMAKENFQYEVFSNYVRLQYSTRNISAISHGCLAPSGKIQFIYLIKCTLHGYRCVSCLIQLLGSTFSVFIPEHLTPQTLGKH